MVLRRELGGNAVDEKSLAVGIGVGYQEDTRWAKKSTPLVRGGGGILKNHLSCTVFSQTIRWILFIFGTMIGTDPKFYSATPCPCLWPQGQS